MKIYVAGHRGMAGSALVRRLRRGGYRDIVVRTRAELDLTEQRAVFDFLARERPDYIFVAAAIVGGIHANHTRGAQFLYENLAIEANIIHGAHRAGVRRLLFLGSSCIYPSDCPQPIAKIAGLRGVQPAVRHGLQRRHADQVLWSERQLRLGNERCPRRAAARRTRPS